MIAVIDYDMGNVGSIQNIYKHIGFDDVIVTREYEKINTASHLILPGVGAFDSGMENLNKYALVDILSEQVLEKGKPILGICLGMQLLGRRSEEGHKEGLSFIEFDSVRFDAKRIAEFSGMELKIPHMGWDYVDIEQKDSKLSSDLGNGDQRYYFVHSYHAVCDYQDNILMSCDYGYRFTAAVVKENIYGVQFHPEKSHKYGMTLLKRFAEL